MTDPRVDLAADRSARDMVGLGRVGPVMVWTAMLLGVVLTTQLVVNLIFKHAAYTVRPGREQSSVLRASDVVSDVTVDAVEACRDRLMPQLTQLEKTQPRSGTAVRRHLSTCRRYLTEGRVRHVTVLINHTHTWPTSDVTLITHLSLDRFSRLEEIARYWTGSMSVALYLDVKDVWLALLGLVCSSPHLNRRHNVHYSLLYKAGSFYPTNALRNLAIRAATSPYIVTIGVDLLPKPGLHVDLEALTRKLDVEREMPDTAWVVPAFETTAVDDVNDVSLLSMPDNKSMLIGEIINGNLRTYRAEREPSSYNGTRYDLWMSADVPYQVTYERGFEPYVVVRRDRVPRYDERFLGRYGNKLSFIETLYYKGFRFVVLPRVYVVHVPQPDWEELVNSARTYFKCAARIYKEFRQEMRRNYPDKYEALWAQPIEPKPTEREAASGEERKPWRT